MAICALLPYPLSCFPINILKESNIPNVHIHRRGMAIYAGRDVSKLKNKGGKWKYVSSVSPRTSNAPPLTPASQIHERARYAVYSCQILAVQVCGLWLGVAFLRPVKSMANTYSLNRSLFMWYMWRIGDVDVSVMQKS